MAKDISISVRRCRTDRMQPKQELLYYSSTERRIDRKRLSSVQWKGQR